VTAALSRGLRGPDDPRTVDGSSAEVCALCHNPDEAERDAAAREAAIARITGELDRITTARTRAREQTRTRRAAKDMTPAARRGAEQTAERDEAAHVKAECALREHPALGRWLRQTPAGRLQLDRAKIAAQARLDGKYLLSTSDPDLSAEDVAAEPGVNCPTIARLRGSAAPPRPSRPARSAASGFHVTNLSAEASAPCRTTHSRHRLRDQRRDAAADPLAAGPRPAPQRNASIVLAADQPAEGRRWRIWHPATFRLGSRAAAT
jgi:hypothetical protein